MNRIDRCGFIKQAGIGSAIAAAAPRTPFTDGPGAAATTDPLIERRLAADKLAANVAIGRNAAGIHYRSDYWESLLFGEQVALTILQEQKDTYNERVTFSLTLFDGTRTSV